MKSKLQFIEGIRGIAAFVVILQHFVLMFDPTFYTGTVDTANTHFLNPALEHNIAISPLNILYNGNFAVCIFFVLSGFVLSYKYFKTDNANLLLESTLKRYFRLLIPVAFSVVFTLIVLAIFRPDPVKLETYTHSGDWLKNLFHAKPGILDVIYNIFIDVFINGSNKYNPVVWVMGVEFLGSIMLFSVLMLSHSIKRKNIVLLIVIIFLTISGNHFYAALFMGALIGLNFVKKEEQPQRNPWLNIGLLLFGLYLGSYPTAWEYLMDSIYYPLQILGINVMNFSLVLGSALLIFMVSKSSSCQKIFSLKLFVFLGKVSFPSYLIHMVIILCVSNLLFPHFLLSHSYLTSFLICAVISLGITYVTSWLVYKFVDQPAVRLSNQIAKKAIGFLNR